MELTNEYKEKLLNRFNDDYLKTFIDDLEIVEVKYIDFNNEIQTGKLVCHTKIVEDVEYIFENLLENKYQLEKVKLADEYDFNDDISMAENNVSCFNFRKILGTDDYSNHSYGLAIDINPLYNPYVAKVGDEVIVLPDNALEYADRDKDFKHKITNDDLCCKLFKERGFEWGGDWEYPDFQHFEKLVPGLNKLH